MAGLGVVFVCVLDWIYMDLVFDNKTRIRLVLLISTRTIFAIYENQMTKSAKSHNILHVSFLPPCNSTKVLNGYFSKMNYPWIKITKIET